MSKTRRVIASEDFGLAPKYKSSDKERPFTRTLETEVSYNIGGANYFSGRTDERGYYVSVSMCERRKEQSFNVERIGIGSGTAIKALIEPAPRFNAKRLAAIVPDADLVARIREQVLANVRRNDERDAQLYGPPVVLAGR